MKVLLLLGVLLTSGCLSSVPPGPTTAPPAQVSACETDATVHNIAMVTGLALSASSAGMGSLETQTSDNGTKNGLAVAIVSTAVAAVITTAVTSIEGANYSASGCPAILGPLPVGAKKP